MTHHVGRLTNAAGMTERFLLEYLIGRHHFFEDLVMKNLADVQAALGDLSAQVDSVKAAVTAGFASSAAVDLQPAMDQIAAIQGQVASIPTQP